MAAALDGVDGFVARRFHQRSELGVVLDPAPDQLQFVTAVILLSLDQTHLRSLPLWLVVTLLSRDVLHRPWYASTGSIGPNRSNVIAGFDASGLLTT